jgi:hypothetical protein
MAHDVFISHAHKDKQLAGAICEKLESARVRCWIADRDISVGEDWTEATRKAIGSSHVMVLVLSENANAAPHIEREIAHAFYTGRRIVPVRLTNTLPRRDFLFYLGNVRWFDAFNPPEEGHLEALAASINGMVHGHSDPGEATAPQNKTKTRSRLDFSDSWLGALRASHYQTLENLKRVGIVASIGAAGWLLWFALGQTKREELPADGDRHPIAQSGVPLVSPPGTIGNPSGSKPAYTFTRFGLWSTSTSGPTPSASPASAAQSPGAPPLLDENQGTTGEAEGDGAHNTTSARSARGDSRGIVKRNQEHHQRKSRAKGHHERTRASQESREARKRHAATES